MSWAGGRRHAGSCLMVSTLPFISNNYFCMVYFRPTTKLIPDNTGAYLRLSELHYEMGEVEDALRLVRNL